MKFAVASLAIWLALMAASGLLAEPPPSEVVELAAAGTLDPEAVDAVEVLELEDVEHAVTSKGSAATATAVFRNRRIGDSPDGDLW
jgi:hypothetical protein